MDKSTKQACVLSQKYVEKLLPRRSAFSILKQAQTAGRFARQNEAGVPDKMERGEVWIFPGSLILSIISPRNSFTESKLTFGKRMSPDDLASLIVLLPGPQYRLFIG